MTGSVQHHNDTIRFRRMFALAVVACLLVLPGVARGDSSPDSSARREAARAQFDRAQKQRTALEALPESGRTVKAYASLAGAYRRVYLISPRAADVPAALNSVAALYRTMGDLFDEKYYQQAVDAFEFLLREYPTTHYRETALLAIARIQQDDLHDAVLAQKSYEEFLARHPRSSHAAEVRAYLNKLNATAASPKPPRPAEVAKEARPARLEKADATEKVISTTDTREGDARQSSSGEIAPYGTSTPVVNRIRIWNADTYTRLVIDLGAQAKYRTARIANPDRIYFDIENAKILPALLHKSVDVADGGFLKGVRLAENHSGVVRVVLEGNGVTD